MPTSLVALLALCANPLYVTDPNTFETTVSVVLNEPSEWHWITDVDTVLRTKCHSQDENITWVYSAKAKEPFSSSLPAVMDRVWCQFESTKPVKLFLLICGVSHGY